MKKILLLLIKFIPVIQMAGMLLNNTLCYFCTDLDTIYLLDYIIGNSIVTTILLFVCSYIFNYCDWHRLIISANFVNISLANIDAIYCINITDLQLLCIYYIVSITTIIMAITIHINKNERSKT